MSLTWGAFPFIIPDFCVLGWRGSSHVAKEQGDDTGASK